MAVYLASYAPRLGGALGGNVLGALVVALALLVLLLVLGVTSFGFVERRMRTESWKRLQRWAYVFFGLVYVHLMLMLAPAASRGGEAAVARPRWRVWPCARWSSAPTPCCACAGRLSTAALLQRSVPRMLHRASISRPGTAPSS